MELKWNSISQYRPDITLIVSCFYDEHGQGNTQTRYAAWHIVLLRGRRVGSQRRASVEVVIVDLIMLGRGSLGYVDVLFSFRCFYANVFIWCSNNSEL